MIPRMTVLKIATTAKIVAATSAIIAPLPESYSAEKYRPRKTAVSPKICVQIRHERKLRPTNCPVAAGVTSSAVTSNAPIT